MFLLFRFFAFEPVAWRPAAQLVGRAVTAGIIAITFAMAATSPTWAQDPQTAAQPEKKAAAAAPDRNADGSQPDVTVNAGVETRVAIAQDCDQPERPIVVWARADHGTVSIKNIRGPGCGRSSMNLTGFLYTSKPGFKGTDKLYMSGFLTNGNIDRVLTILVK